MTLNTLLVMRPAHHIFAFTVVTTATLGMPVQAQTFQSPDILVLGDSQITFGAGPAYYNFFKNLTRSCRPKGVNRQAIKSLSKNSVAVIGVRSTSLQDWSATTRKGKADICDVDPNLKQNAGAYGTVNRKGAKYVQIGVGPEFQFCKAGVSPTKAALRPDYYQPKLLVLSFLGNTTKRWANDPVATRKDVDAFLRQLPKGQKCLFMTTAPTYKPSENQRRLKAQAGIQAAFARHANKCLFVKGLTDKSMKALTANAHNFRINKDGTVRDPFHPTHLGATVFLRSIKADLCAALSTALQD